MQKKYIVSTDNVLPFAYEEEYTINMHAWIGLSLVKNGLSFFQFQDISWNIGHINEHINFNMFFPFLHDNVSRIDSFL